MDLISLATIKAYLGVTDDTDDDLLEILALLAIGEVESYCDRVFTQQVITNEVLSLGGVDFDLLPVKSFDLAGIQQVARTRQSPIVSGLTVTYDSTELTLETDYKVDLEVGIIYFYTGVGEYERDLLADYTTGYVEATIPAGLKAVILEMIANKYREHGAIKGQGEIKSKRIGDLSVTYKDTRSTPFFYTQILNKYRLVTI